jgi:tetratricopeptide (TPR) repeat protein
MKYRLYIIIVLIISSFSNVYAQKEEALCDANSVSFHKAVNSNKFQEAYLPWKQVIEKCPTLHYYIYTDGEKILKYFLSINKKGTEQYNKYFDELMSSYDMLSKSLPVFQMLYGNVKSPEKVLGEKAVDYLKYASQPDANQAYNWLSEVVRKEKDKSFPEHLFYFLQSSMNRARKDTLQRNQFFQDYLDATQWTDSAIVRATKPNVKQAYVNLNKNLLATLYNSGFTNCSSLEKFYGPQIEEHKTDMEYIKKAMDLMSIMKCTDSKLYATAALYIYKIKPTVKVAMNYAYQSLKKGDVDNAVRYVDEAIEAEDVSSNKAEMKYKAAVMLFEAKNYVKAQSYCLKSIDYSKNYGEPYILIAKMYAMHANWGKDPVLNKCSYYAVVDKLTRAKSVDPKCTEKVNKLIALYTPYFPKAQDLFFMGIKKGSTVHVGGFINENVTIR